LQKEKLAALENQVKDEHIHTLYWFGEWTNTIIMRAAIDSRQESICGID